MCGFKKGRRSSQVWDKFLLHAIGVEAEEQRPLPAARTPTRENAPVNRNAAIASTTADPGAATPMRSGAEEAHQQRRSSNSVLVRCEIGRAVLC